MANREAASFVRTVSPSTEILTEAANPKRPLRIKTSGWSSAIFVATVRAIWSLGGKRKAQRRARKINRSQA